MRQTAIVLVGAAIAVALAMGGCGGEDANEHVGHDHAGEAVGEHAGHEHGTEDTGEHAGHDHGPEDTREWAGHDHADEDVDPEDSHAGHDHGEDALVVLSRRDRDDAGIRLAAAGPGDVELTRRLLGEVRVNEERLAHVVPPASGVVREVHARIGDRVSEGDLLAVIASRELAGARAQYVNALGRRELALIEFERQRELWEREIMAEQDYLDARQALREADIELQTAEQALHALGVLEEELDGLVDEATRHDPAALTRLDLRAPFDGTIIELHMVTGEVVGEESDVLAIADLTTVWIDLNVPQADLAAVREGQRVTVSASGVSVPSVTGVVGFVSPIVDEETRTALARVEIPNESGQWRPGLFVTADLSFESVNVPIRVPKEAVQTLEGEHVVFVPGSEGLRTVPVTLGHATGTHVEVVSGLLHGQEYVVEGAYALKAEIVTSGLDPHAGHGH